MTTLFDVTGRVALVSGASRGIGLAIARSLLIQGAKVAVNGDDEAETAAAARTLNDEFRAPSDRVSALAGDITASDVGAQLVARTQAMFGRIDTLVCNAGIDIIRPAVVYTPAQWDRILTVNLRGGFQVAQAAARHWISRSDLDRSITFTSSIAGAVGFPRLPRTRRARAG